MFEGSFLKTYDPELIEVHSDSSDFDDSIILETPKDTRSKHNITSSETPILKKNKHKLNDVFSFATREIENRSDLFIYASNTIQAGEVIKAIKKKSAKTLVTKECNEDKRKSLNESKVSLLKHKLLPCFSSMFGRSYYKLYAVKETKLKNTKDKICQVQKRNNRKGRNKFYARRNNYIVQPVCTTHCRAFGNMKETQVSLFQRKPKAPVKQYSNTSVTVSLSSQHDDGSNKNERDCKRILKDEIRREYKMYKTKKYRKHQEQQFPSKLGPYQVFTNPYQEQTTLRKTQSKNTSSSSNLPSRSSSFWDNIVDKFCKNKPNYKAGSLKPCVCQDVKPVCSPANCEFFKSDPANKSKDIQCSCTDISPALLKEQHRCFCEKNKKSDNSSKTAKATDASGKLNSSKTKTITKKNSKSKSANIQCECFPKKSKQKTKGKNKSIEGTHMIQSASTPCQQPHDEITQALTVKYKGEILCIHNPPCVLINGCLNLPPPKENPIGVWSVPETRGSIYDVYTNLKSLKNGCDQSCQYDIPSVEVRHCQTSNLKAEKFVQSLCDHTPPCEIVRCCYKHKYDPKLKNSCIHVPMCQKVPECMIERTKQNLMTGSCEHKPRCAEVPICTRDYLILTAKDSVATQVRPQSKFVCRHQPHCVFIPKCLGSAIPESCVPIEAIPDCVHQPLCEMIPACCRKSAKEMISVRTSWVEQDVTQKDVCKNMFMKIIQMKKRR
ncbi:uncharacterized protein LOC101741894 [Bombyx mori]|uniref:Uncharacterized protein n=1 Tax=Bombyx mori TaxID=7091 RepID=A0A8R2GBF6_BOMMO|nr:uncharacterized protein LOC101741894 [Bombyx mori]